MSACAARRGVRASKGPSWYRCFAFYIDDVQVGEGAVHGSRSSRRPTHSASDRAPGRAGLLVVHERRAVRPCCPGCRATMCGLHHIHRRSVSDLDINNHVNNVRVVELISDALDLQKQPGFVSSLQVNYTAETAFGEQVSLLCGTVDGARLYPR